MKNYECLYEGEVTVKLLVVTVKTLNLLPEGIIFFLLSFLNTEQKKTSWGLFLEEFVGVSSHLQFSPLDFMRSQYDQVRCAPLNISLVFLSVHIQE